MHPITCSAGYCAIVTALAVSISGCEKETIPVVSTDIVRPAQILEITPEDAATKLRFPGRVRAIERAELSFNVPGYLIEFGPLEGSAVRAGDVVAKLEDRVFKARVAAALAEFNRTKTDLERYRRLWETERAVAKSEVDDRVSQLEVARTNLAAAEQDLADTTLRAPFDGVITRRRIETFASVQAKQPIADLQNLATLEVVIHVPERTFRTERPRKQALAVFDEMQTPEIPLTLRSYTTEADPQTQTYEVVLTVDHIPPGLSLLPGMAVTVMPFVSPSELDQPGIWIPISAVVASADRSKFVWAVGSDGSVSVRPVVTGEVRGAEIEVVSGLFANDKIVTAGVHSLKNGMKVRPLPGN